MASLAGYSPGTAHVLIDYFGHTCVMGICWSSREFQMQSTLLRRQYLHAFAFSLFCIPKLSIKFEHRA